ncbi:MAG: hypothetical protein GY845_35420 [Planctomycetes bacterium]|nr:hypothetical protein [Planctomycetota bacterium]
MATPSGMGFGGSTIGAGSTSSEYHVTSLSDSGNAENTPGTLRYGLKEYRDVPMKIFFDFDGIIRLSKPLIIDGDRWTIDGRHSSVTIDGPTKVTNGFEIIIRNLRFRLGAYWRNQVLLGHAYDALSLRAPLFQVLISQSSISWGTDENCSCNGDGDKSDPLKTKHINNITIERCLIAEAFGNTDDPSPNKNEHRYAGLATPANHDQICFVECAFMHHASRILRFGHRMTNPDTAQDNFVAMIRCVIYGWRKEAGYNGSDTEVPCRSIIGGNSYWQAPYSSLNDEWEIFFEKGGTHQSRAYVRNNQVDGEYRPRKEKPYKIIDFDKSWSKHAKKSYRHTKKFPVPNIPDYETKATNADDIVRNAGALLPVVDSIDSRLKHEFTTKTGTLVEDWADIKYYL